jgi:hypothetical protein
LEGTVTDSARAYRGYLSRLLQPHLRDARGASTREIAEALYQFGVRTDKTDPNIDQMR